MGSARFRYVMFVLLGTILLSGCASSHRPLSPAPPEPRTQASQPHVNSGNDSVSPKTAFRTVGSYKPGDVKSVMVRVLRYDKNGFPTDVDLIVKSKKEIREFLKAFGPLKITEGLPGEVCEFVEFSVKNEKLGFGFYFLPEDLDHGYPPAVKKLMAKYRKQMLKGKHK